MEPKINEKAWEPKLEEQILKNWNDTGLYDFILEDIFLNNVSILFWNYY